MLHPVQNDNVRVSSSDMKSRKMSTQELYVKHGGSSLSRPVCDGADCSAVKAGFKGFAGPRASPPIDVRRGHPLLHMQLEPWDPPCVLFDWWFNQSWKFWEMRLVDIVVLPMSCKPLHLFSVLSLTLPLGTP